VLHQLLVTIDHNGCAVRTPSNAALLCNLAYVVSLHSPPPEVVVQLQSGIVKNIIGDLLHAYGFS
jgi:hypothetical protein